MPCPCRFQYTHFPPPIDFSLLLHCLHCSMQCLQSIHIGAFVSFGYSSGIGLGVYMLIIVQACQHALILSCCVRVSRWECQACVSVLACSEWCRRVVLACMRYSCTCCWLAAKVSLQILYYFFLIRFLSCTMRVSVFALNAYYVVVHLRFIFVDFDTMLKPGRAVRDPDTMHWMWVLSFHMQLYLC